MVLLYPSTAESLHEQIEHLAALGVLADMELGNELQLQSRGRVPLDSYVKTSFSVDEAGQIGVEPFLLIVRTDQIVTAHISHPKTGV